MRVCLAAILACQMLLGRALAAGNATNGTGIETTAAFGWGTTPTPRPPVLRNVTLSGLGALLLRLPAGWGYVWVAEDIETSTGPCPAGRYCPVGAGAPVVCPLGTYSPSTGRTGVCLQACAANSYCPDPAVQYACPGHTTSAGGSASQLDCACDPGYQCVYRKQVNLHVVLQLPLAAWNGDAAVRNALVQAVADSAGVSVGNVRIEYVAPQIGGTRRLLTLRTMPGTQLRLAVRGAERLRGIDGRLARGHPALRRAETRWQRAHTIQVSRRPGPS